MKALGMRGGVARWHPCLVPYKEGHRHFEHNDCPKSESQEELKLILIKIFSHKTNTHQQSSRSQKWIT